MKSCPEYAAFYRSQVTESDQTDSKRDETTTALRSCSAPEGDELVAEEVAKIEGLIAALAPDTTADRPVFPRSWPKSTTHPAQGSRAKSCLHSPDRRRHAARGALRAGR